MPKPSKLNITILVLLLAVGGVVGVRFFLAARNISTSAAVEPRAKGNLNAPIQITEFIDFQCPACANGAKHIAKVMAEHPQAIHLSLKYYPLKNHRHGFIAARYAECAARQKKFWAFHDLVIDRQPNWSRLMDATAAFSLMADEIALNENKMKACLDDKSVDADIEQNRLDGDRRGIQSTPTYYINGKMIVGVPSMELEVERLLSEIKK